MPSNKHKSKNCTFVSISYFQLFEKANRINKYSNVVSTKKMNVLHQPHLWLVAFFYDKHKENTLDMYASVEVRHKFRASIGLAP